MSHFSRESGTEFRLAWLETYAEGTPPLGTSTAGADAGPSPGHGAEPEGNDEAVAHDRNAEGGIPSEGTRGASGRDGGGQERPPVGTSPTLAWAASLGEEEGNSAGGGTTTDQEVDRLWDRMHKVEDWVYLARANEWALPQQVMVASTAGYVVRSPRLQACHHHGTQPAGHLVLAV